MPSTLLEQTGLHKDIHAALRAWRNLAGTPENLLAFLLLVQEQRRMLVDDNSANIRLATNRVLLEGIESLAKQNEQAAEILKLRFLDNDIILRVGAKLHLSEDEVKKRQHGAIKALSQIIFNLETAVRQERIQYLESGLDPPTYTTLFGVDNLQETVTANLLAADAPPIIALSGIGGIGKTALANAATRAAIQHFHFEDVIWLRVTMETAVQSIHQLEAFSFEHLQNALIPHLCPHLPPETTPRRRLFHIRQILKATPYLIVIDNLEQETTLELLAQLHNLAQPSRFLLTTRIQPPQHSGILSLTLPGLSAKDVAHFGRHHAKELGLAELRQISDEEAMAIYNLVGGNPLALKLVVNLATVVPLDQILEDLTQAKLNQVEAMYRHIYWQTWQTLSDESQTLLKMMPLVADVGGTADQLAAISGLDKTSFWSAISELVKRSLLEVRGTAQSRRYGIHRLTAAYLQTEIIKLAPS